MYKYNIINAIEEVTDADIIRFAQILSDCKDRGGKVILAGNGGSSAICSHFANDLIKTLHIAAVCLTDNVPTLTAYANDKNYDIALGEIADVLARKDDVFVLMSTSGKSQNILHLAFRFKNPTIALVGNKGGDMAKWHKHVHYLFTEGIDVRSNEDLFSIICHAVIDYLVNN